MLDLARHWRSTAAAVKKAISKPEYERHHIQLQGIDAAADTVRLKHLSRRLHLGLGQPRLYELYIAYDHLRCDFTWNACLPGAF